MGFDDMCFFVNFVLYGFVGIYWLSFHRCFLNLC